jgi:hypothetical protein
MPLPSLLRLRCSVAKENSANCHAFAGNRTPDPLYTATELQERQTRIHGSVPFESGLDATLVDLTGDLPFNLGIAGCDVSRGASSEKKKSSDSAECSFM